MKTMIKTIALGSALALVSLAAQPVLAAKNDPAPAEGAPVQGIGFADLNAAAANSNAVKNAAQQRQTYYKAQIDQYQARGQAIQSQLRPLVEKYQRDGAAPGANQAALQQQAAAIQKIQQDGQQELNNIIKPVVYSEAYASEQVDEKLEQAVRNAMAARKVTLLLKPEATLLAGKSYDLTDDVTAQLNTLVPSAQLVPPAGWEPRQVREAKAQQAGGQQPQPSAPAPSGR